MKNDRSTAFLSTTAASPSAGDEDRTARARVSHPRPDRMTITAGAALLVICILHTAVFAVHPWWGEWLAGPFRAAQPSVESILQFWALPGGLAVPGALLALLIIETGRRGRAVPLSIGVILGVWALACVWLIGPSGFLLLLVPAVLMIVAGARARRSGTRR